MCRFPLTYFVLHNNEIKAKVPYIIAAFNSLRDADDFANGLPDEGRDYSVVTADLRIVKA